MRLYFVILRMRFQSGTSLHEGKSHVESCCDQVALFFARSILCFKREGSFTSLSGVWKNLHKTPSRLLIMKEGPLWVVHACREYIDSTFLLCNAIQQWYLWFEIYNCRIPFKYSRKVKVTLIVLDHKDVLLKASKNSITANCVSILVL